MRKSEPSFKKKILDQQFQKRKMETTVREEDLVNTTKTSRNPFGILLWRWNNEFHLLKKIALLPKVIKHLHGTGRRFPNTKSSRSHVKEDRS